VRPGADFIEGAVWRLARKRSRCRRGFPPRHAPDALLLIGDRGMLPSNGAFAFEWDLGEEWSRWTGLPFVFAMWIARPGVDLRSCRGPGRRATMASPASRRLPERQR